MGAQIITSEGRVVAGIQPSSLNYNAGSFFDSTTKTFICSDPSSEIANFACKIKSLRLWYTYFTQQDAQMYLYEIYRIEKMCDKE